MQARHVFGHDIERAAVYAHRRVGELQAARIGVRRICQDGACRPAFDRAARVHDDNLVADLRRKPQIVSDEDYRRAVPALHVGEQPNDRRLHGDIQRRRRLVGNDKTRIAGEGHRDQRALAHAPRQLMRITLQKFAGPWQLRCLKQRDGPSPALGAVAAADPGEVLVKLGGYCENRIKCSQRRLRDEGNRASKQPTPLQRVHLHKVLTLECQTSGCDNKPGRQKLRDRAPDHRFSRARFADEAENFFAAEFEGQRANCWHGRATDACFDSEAFDLQGGRHASGPFPPAARRACGEGRRQAS
jgi:hypothetical protein